MVPDFEGVLAIGNYSCDVTGKGPGGVATELHAFHRARLEVRT